MYEHHGVIAVFAKPPRPGEVKTRLASSVGDGPAAMLATSTRPEPPKPSQRLRSATAPMRLSVIIPTLNEAQLIGEQVRHTASLAGVREVVVADGGSTDETLLRVPQLPTVRTVVAPRGRAAQMNTGAKMASGDVLLFLHADVRLPADAAAQVGAALIDSRTVGGAFQTWTVADRPTWLGPLLHLADLRSRYTGLPYGDQAQFVRRAAFDAAGGFPEQPLMEDLELSIRLRRQGMLARVPARVTVSGRRFIARPIFFTIIVNVFPALYRLGVAPEALDRRGVSVDDSLRSSNPRIYASGDVAGRWQFTHAADAMSRIVLQNALFWGRKKVSTLTIPWATYTDPEIAHAGILHTEAAGRGEEVVTYTVHLNDVDRAILESDEEGFARVYANAKSGQILGATLVCRDAGDLIGEMALAITN